jgi:SAM-dependent methyltransferase
MIDIARQHAPALPFTVGSMLELPVADAAWAGAVALCSIIHLSDSDRARACHELGRAIRPNGWLLVSFHVASAEFAAGEVDHLTSFLGHAVELDGCFLGRGNAGAIRSDGGVQSCVS